MRIAMLFALAFCLSVASCRKEKSLSKIPEIKFESLSTDMVKAASSDEVEIVFSFSDGNADLGNFGDSVLRDIYVRDSRADSLLYTFYFPDIEQYLQNPELGVSGICAFPFQATFLKLRPTHPNADTLQFEIYIRDKAGNQSNIIMTPPIYLSK